MPMKKPVHPGRIVKKSCIEALGLGVNEAAAVLGVSRSSLSRVINEHGSISSEMAIRLSKAFGQTPGFWLRMQLNYDLAQVEKQAKRIKLEPYPRPAPLPEEQLAYSP